MYLVKLTVSTAEHSLFNHAGTTHVRGGGTVGDTQSATAVDIVHNVSIGEVHRGTTLHAAGDGVVSITGFTPDALTTAIHGTVDGGTVDVDFGGVDVLVATGHGYLSELTAAINVTADGAAVEGNHVVRCQSEVGKGVSVAGLASSAAIHIAAVACGGVKTDVGRAIDGHRDASHILRAVGCLTDVRGTHRSQITATIHVAADGTTVDGDCSVLGDGACHRAVRGRILFINQADT